MEKERLDPQIESLMASISSVTAHVIAFVPSREDCAADALVIDVAGEDGQRYGVLEIRPGDGSVLETHLHLYRQLAELIGRQIDLQRLNLSLENRFRLIDRQNDELAAVNRALSDMAYRDPLTGLYRRWYLTEQCRLEIRRAARSNRPFALLLVDLDHFKRVNDVQGHAAGDAVLKTFAALLLQCCRTSDVVARFGGDEFCILLTDSPPSAAADVAERIRHRCEHAGFVHRDAKFALTCSVGVGVYGAELSESSQVEALLDDIDRAMYAAKNAGRNRVQISREALTAPAVEAN